MTHATPLQFTTAEQKAFAPDRTIAEIARITGRPPEVLRRHAKRFGLPYKSAFATADQRQSVLDMRHAGVPVLIIASRVGLTDTQVRWICRQDREKAVA